MYWLGPTNCSLVLASHLADLTRMLTRMGGHMAGRMAGLPSLSMIVYVRMRLHLGPHRRGAWLPMGLPKQCRLVQCVHRH